MADPPHHPDPGDFPGTPRWVKVYGLAAIVFVLVVVVVHLAGGGFRHHGAEGDTPPSGVTERGAPTP
ncbi:MAG TPA: hypothetical protein VFQ76_17720 [Longimicrobiaceae bacterium]|nr:hypothetical protein [Longimicrobiaceae bacterium]